MQSGPQTIPPKITTPPSPALFAIVVLGLTALGAGAVMFFFDPNRHGFYPACLFHTVTGLYCPSCGGTRAIYELLHGHVLIALKDNALFVLTLPVLAVWGARFANQRAKNQPATLAPPPKALLAFLIIAAIFAVLRNLPAVTWLSP